MANPYIWWVWPLQTKRVMKTARKEQGEAIMDIYFVRVVLKAVL